MAVLLRPTQLTVGTSPVITQLPTDYANRWNLLFRTDSGSPGNITSFRYRRYAIHDGEPGPWESYSLSSPLTPGDVAALREWEDCSAYLDLEFTGSTAGVLVNLEAGMPPRGT